MRRGDLRAAAVGVVPRWLDLFRQWAPKTIRISSIMSVRVAGPPPGLRTRTQGPSVSRALKEDRQPRVGKPSSWQESRLGVSRGDEDSPISLPGQSIRMRGCPAGDVGEGVVESLDHQFGHAAIVTWVEADPPATVEVVGGGDDRRANGDR